jgi:hypothetical protein
MIAMADTVKTIKQTVNSSTIEKPRSLFPFFAVKFASMLSTLTPSNGPEISRPNHSSAAIVHVLGQDRAG